MNHKKYDKLIGRSAVYKEVIAKKEKNWKYLILSICSFGLLFTCTYFLQRWLDAGIVPEIKNIANTLIILLIIVVIQYASYLKAVPYVILLADLYFIFISLKSPTHQYTEIPLLVIIPIISYFSFPINKAVIINWISMGIAYMFFLPLNSILGLEPQDLIYTLIIFSSFVLVSIISFFSARVYEDHTTVMKREFFFDIQTGLPGWELLKLRMTQVPESTICLFRVLNTESLCKAWGMENFSEINIKFCNKLENSDLFDNVEIFKLSKGDLVFFWDRIPDEKEIDGIMKRFGLSSVFIEEKTFYLKAVAGVAKVQNDPSLTLRQAEIALGTALESQKLYHTFNPSCMDEGAYSDETPFQQLVNCLENDRMELFFQPIVDSKSEQTVKAEALVRFFDSHGKSLPLGPILKSAYQTGMNGRMTQQILRKAVNWSLENNLSVSANVGFEDIRNTAVINTIFQINREMKNRGLTLTLEILESSSMKNSDSTLLFLSQMRDEGVEIAIDDFGSGYANIERILMLHADIIKLDGSLVRQLVHSEAARDLVATICQLARNKGTRVVAEHVENLEILHWVQLNSVDYYQGFLFGIPAPGRINEKNQIV